MLIFAGEIVMERVIAMVMMKRLDDLQRSVDSICGASQKGVVWQKRMQLDDQQSTLLLTLKPLQHFTDFG